MLNIKELDNTVYNYIFEIDNIKKSFCLYTQLYLNVEKCEYIKDIDKRRVKRLALQFKLLCKKIIRRDKINTFEDYKLCVQSLVVINAKVQKILNSEDYYKFKKISDIEKEYNKINNYLSYSNSFLTTFINDHLTAFGIILIIVVSIIVIFLLSFKNCNLGIIIIVLLSFIFSICYFIFHKKITRNFNVDHINKTISNNTYVKSLKIKIAHKNIKDIILSKR